jgi:hypothetical protein
VKEFNILECSFHTEEEEGHVRIHILTSEMTGIHCELRYTVQIVPAKLNASEY